MKFLIIFLISISSTFACNNFIPDSEADKAIALEPNAGSKQCSDLPKEECHCYDGIDFRIAVKVSEVDEIGVYTGKHHLENSPAKEADYEASKLAEIEALNTKEAERITAEKYVEDNLSTATTTAKLKLIIENMRKAQK